MAQLHYDASFHYQPLENNATIRLVSFAQESTSGDIHLSLSHKQSYFEDGQYIALSYCWGALEPKKSITIDGFPFFITPNLFAALSAISEHVEQDKPGNYWIDAICLNQTDIEEKNAQVPNMWRIYSAASSVLAWLGPADGSTALAFKGIEEVAATCTNRSIEECNAEWNPAKFCRQSRRGKLEIEAMNALCSRPYFTRAWIRPECAQAQHLILLVGTYSCSVQRFLHYFWVPDQRPSFTKVQSLLEKQQTWPEVHEQGPQASALLVQILEEYSQAQCSDFHDRIYASYGDPRVVKMDMTKRPRVNYRIGREELALLVLMWFDHLDDPECENMEHVGEELPPLNKEFLDILCVALGLRGWDIVGPVMCEVFYKKYAEKCEIGWTLYWLLEK